MYPQFMLNEYYNFSPENYHFYSHEQLEYIAWACYRNVEIRKEKHAHEHQRHRSTCASALAISPKSLKISSRSPAASILNSWNASFYILREINLAISDKAGCISDLLTEWKII